MKQINAVQRSARESQKHYVNMMPLVDEDAAELGVRDKVVSRS